MVDYKIYKTGSGYDVFYQEIHHGGGIRWAPEFRNYFEKNSIRCNTLVEWCCGPGYIGFELLTSGFCEKLVLHDINKEVFLDVEQTLSRLPQKFSDKVEIIHSNTLSSVTGCVDCIVGNPPHVDVLDPSTPALPFYNDPPILYSDPGWQIHKNFFNDACKKITKDGFLLLLENGYYSDLSTFLEMGSEVGLELTSIQTSHPKFWFMRGVV